MKCFINLALLTSLSLGIGYANELDVEQNTYIGKYGTLNDKGEIIVLYDSLPEEIKNTRQAFCESIGTDREEIIPQIVINEGTKDAIVCVKDNDPNSPKKLTKENSKKIIDNQYLKFLKPPFEGDISNVFKKTIPTK